MNVDFVVVTAGGATCSDECFNDEYDRRIVATKLNKSPRVKDIHFDEHLHTLETSFPLSPFKGRSIVDERRASVHAAAIVNVDLEIL